MSGNQKDLAVDAVRIGQSLEGWFNDGAGTKIVAAELELAAAILPNLFGYHILQLGNQVSETYIRTTRIAHAMVSADEVGDGRAVTLTCRHDALPLSANTIDVLVAPHVLEFAADPHAVLREVERVLIGEGHVVIVGFNPWSLCGLWRLAAGWRRRAPWNGHFRSAARIKDWLKLLGFEIELFKKTSFRPPIRHAGISRKLETMELLGRTGWPFFGNIYLIVAKKRVSAITPLKASWQTRRSVIAKGVAEPSTRTTQEISMSRK